MNRVAMLAVFGLPFAVGACAQTGAYSNTAEHCKSALTRMVGPDDTVVVRETTLGQTTINGAAVDTVTLGVEINERRVAMRCAYPHAGTLSAGTPGAVEIVLAGQQVPPGQLAQLNKVVSDNEEPFTTFRKRLPTLPGINIDQTEGKLGRRAFSQDDYDDAQERVPEKN